MSGILGMSQINGLQNTAGLAGGQSTHPTLSNMAAASSSLGSVPVFQPNCNLWKNFGSSCSKRVLIELYRCFGWILRTRNFGLKKEN